jgi:hypothetical protein
MRENPSNDVGEPSQMLAHNLGASVRYTVTSQSTTLGSQMCAGNGWSLAGTNQLLYHVPP